MSFGEENIILIPEVVDSKSSESTAPLLMKSASQNSSIQNSGNSAMSVISKGADNYVDSMLDKLSSISQIESVNNAIKDSGLEYVVKDLNKERVKSILAAIGLFACFKALKSHYGKALVVVAAIYLIGINRDKLTNAIASLNNQKI